VARKDLFRGVVLGAVVSTVVLMAASAMAGTGIGAVFNLGQTNQVNATSTLRGSSGKTLQVTNTGTGSGVGITVGAGKAPIKVNAGAGKATYLNADRVDGKHSNQLVRAARMVTGATTVITTSDVTYGTALSITAPAAGFVLVNADVTITRSGCTTQCVAWARVRHIQTGSTSTYSETSLYAETFAEVSPSYVFPVSAGVNTFDIRLARFAGDGTLYGWWGQMNALYVPFGSTGSGTLRPSGAAATSVDKGLDSG
jgi:hypothetical protein